MLSFKKQGCQGELTFTRVNKLPKDVKLQESGSQVIVGHSESGHHHVAKGNRVEYFLTNDPNICYLKVEGDMYVEHLKQGAHQHEALKGEAEDKGPNIWRVNKQKQLNAENLWETVRD